MGFSLFWIKIEFTQLTINFAADALPVAFRCTPCLVKCSLFCSNFNNVASLKGFTIFISLVLKESTSLLTQDVSGRSNLKKFTKLGTKMVAHHCHPRQSDFHTLSGVEREGKSLCQRMTAACKHKYLIVEMPDDRRSQEQ